MKSKTDLEATFEMGGITKTGQVTITLTVIEIPEGLVINRLFYPGKFLVYFEILKGHIHNKAHNKALYLAQY